MKGQQAPSCDIPRAEDELVSVVITTMNRFDECCRCLKSVLAQDYPSIEVIVVEDGSDSGMERYISELASPVVSYIRQPQRKGLSAARNAGINVARGEFIAFSDDDDVWKPQRVSRQMAHWRRLAEPGPGRVALVYCGAEIINSAGATVGFVIPRNKGPLKQSILLLGIGTVPSSCIFHRAALANVGGFDETLTSSVDHDVWMSIASAGYEVDFVPDPLVVTVERINRDTMMSRTSERIKGVTDFVAKWRDTWSDWYNGHQYADHYYTQVIASLAGDQIAQGRLGQAWIAGAAVLSGSRSFSYALMCLVSSLLRGIVRGLRSKLRLRRSTVSRGHA